MIFQLLSHALQDFQRAGQFFSGVDGSDDGADARLAL
jgi:hypothetical protein